MMKLALYVQLEAKPGKEMELENFLQKAKELVDAEPETSAWFAIKMGPSKFGIFDAFESEAGREKHLMGEVAKQLKEKASDLLVTAPVINKIDLLAVKVPEQLGEKKVA